MIDKTHDSFLNHHLGRVGRVVIASIVAVISFFFFTCSLWCERVAATTSHKLICSKRSPYALWSCLKRQREWVREREGAYRQVHREWVQKVWIICLSLLKWINKTWARVDRLMHTEHFVSGVLLNTLVWRAHTPICFMKEASEYFRTFSSGETRLLFFGFSHTLAHRTRSAYSWMCLALQTLCLLRSKRCSLG